MEALLAGLAGVAAAIVLAIVIDAPTVYVAVLSSLGGAAYAVTGARLVLGRLEVGNLDGRPIAVMRGYPMSWFLPIPVGYVVLQLHRRAHQRRSAAGQPEPPVPSEAGDAATSGDAAR
jgi:hypothetical protein